jgi:hypothetical protein
MVPRLGGVVKKKAPPIPFRGAAWSLLPLANLHYIMYRVPRKLLSNQALMASNGLKTHLVCMT